MPMIAALLQQTGFYFMQTYSSFVIPVTASGCPMKAFALFDGVQ